MTDRCLPLPPDGTSVIEKAVKLAFDGIAYFSVDTAQQAEDIKVEAASLGFSAEIAFNQGVGGDSSYGVYVWRS